MLLDSRDKVRGACAVDSPASLCSKVARESADNISQECVSDLSNVHAPGCPFAIAGLEFGPFSALRMFSAATGKHTLAAFHALFRFHMLISKTR